MNSLEAVYIKKLKGNESNHHADSNLSMELYGVACHKHTNIDVKLYDTLLLHQDSGKLTMSRNASRSRTIPAILVTNLN